jgi:hypothetical protein
MVVVVRRVGPAPIQYVVLGLSIRLRRSVRQLSLKKGSVRQFCSTFKRMVFLFTHCRPGCSHPHCIRSWQIVGLCISIFFHISPPSSPLTWSHALGSILDRMFLVSIPEQVKRWLPTILCHCVYRALTRYSSKTSSLSMGRSSSIIALKSKRGRSWALCRCCVRNFFSF